VGHFVVLECLSTAIRCDGLKTQGLRGAVDVPPASVTSVRPPLLSWPPPASAPLAFEVEPDVAPGLAVKTLQGRGGRS